jgi:hypothetical protein
MKLKSFPVILTVIVVVVLCLCAGFGFRVASWTLQG